MSDEIMSTPIQELNNSNNSTVQEVIKNYNNLNEHNNDDNQQINNKNFEYTMDQDLYEQDNSQNEEQFYETPVQNLQQQQQHQQQRKKKSSLKNSNIQKKSLLQLLKPYLILFVLLIILFLPFFDIKILKFIPKTMDKYDNITYLGVFLKSAITVIIYYLITKFSN